MHFAISCPKRILSGNICTHTINNNRRVVHIPIHTKNAQNFTRQRKQIVHLSAGAPLRNKDTGNKSYILVLGHHFETKTPATNRTSSCWGTTSKPRHRRQIVHLRAGAPLPRHRQQIVHLSAGAPLRDQDTGNKSYIFVLGHHFETKTPATNRTS